MHNAYLHLLLDLIDRQFKKFTYNNYDNIQTFYICIQKSMPIR